MRIEQTRDLSIFENGGIRNAPRSWIGARGAALHLCQNMRILRGKFFIASGFLQSTVVNIFNRNTTPSVATLESICGRFGITLAQFFAEGELVELSQEQKEMFAA